MKRFWLCLCICLVLLAANSLNGKLFAQSSENDILERSLTAWKEYENIRVTGELTITTADTPSITRAFEMKIGRAKNSHPQPWEVLFFVKNPGEPHLERDTIVEEASGFDGVFSFNFKRNLITKDPPALRYNDCSVFAGEIAQREAEFVRRSVLTRWETPSSLFTDAYEKKEISRLKSALRVEKLGEEKYLGHDATKYRLISPKEGARTEDSSIIALIATQPSFQILEIQDLTGPKFRVESELNMIGKAILKTRSVTELTVFNSWLIPKRSNYIADLGKGSSKKYEVIVQNADPLTEPIAWFFDQTNLSGTEFRGSGEKANRNGTKRKTYFHTKDVSYLPFTEDEQAKIGKYLLSRNPATPNKLNWISISFWITGVTIVTAVIGALTWSQLRK